MTKLPSMPLYNAILALPLEADRTALLAEAVKLPEIAALIEAAKEQWQYMQLCNDKGDLERNIRTALQPFLALETP